MKVVCLSDTHMKHLEIDVPDGDILIHAGDMTNLGFSHELENVAKWMGTLPHERKLVICGNHEKAVSENTELVADIFGEHDIEVIHNITVEIGGFKFYGEPRTPDFYNWGWKYDRGEEAKKVWSNLPDDTDILVCHGPPYRHGDLCPKYIGMMPSMFETVNVGCVEQLERLKEVKPKYVICGHIHYSHGVHKTNFGTTIINASICTEQYKPTNKPICFGLGDLNE